MRERQRLEKNAADDTEDRGVGADAERERKDRDEREAGRLRRLRRAYATS